MPKDERLGEKARQNGTRYLLVGRCDSARARYQHVWSQQSAIQATQESVPSPQARQCVPHYRRATTVNGHLVRAQLDTCRNKEYPILARAAIPKVRILWRSFGDSNAVRLIGVRPLARGVCTGFALSLNGHFWVVLRRSLLLSGSSSSSEMRSAHAFLGQKSVPRWAIVPTDSLAR